MDTKIIRVLVTGVGSPGGPGILQSLKSENDTVLIGIDNDINASGAGFCDHFFKVPKATEDKYMERLLNICSEYKPEVIIPLVTKELNLLSKNINKFSSMGINVMVSEIHALEIVNNKARLYENLREEKNLLPEYALVNNSKLFSSSVIKLGYPNKKIVMRLAEGNGSRGFRILSENENKYDALFLNKPSNNVITLDEIIKVIQEREIPEIVLSEFLPGIEVTVDSIVHKGKILRHATRTRDKIVNGISVAGKFIQNEDIDEKILKIVKKFDGLYGPIGFQFKQDEDGNYKLLEINPRLQGASVTALGVGINFPMLCVSLATNRADLDVQTKKSHVEFRRYWTEIFYEYHDPN